MELKLDNVTKKFGNFTAVDEVNLVLEKGVYGLLGVNGAGKTTLMRMLCTLLVPSGGQILYGGEDIFKMDSRYRNIIGYLPQDFGFYPDFTVKDYLMYIGSLKGIRPGITKKRMKELIEKVGLSRVENRKMKKLSGGMKRRVGIAQALMNEPDILILDEPTAGLDPNERIRFRNLISQIAEEKTVLLSTHIVSDVEYIANRIFLMKDGEIFYSGTAAELAAGMKEQVWLCRVKNDEVKDYTGRCKIANIRTEGEEAELRIISAKKPCENARMVRGTLEDVFLYYFGECKEEGEND